MVEKIIRFKQVSSTQDTAKRLVHKQEELAVISLSQKHGKGRQGRVWYSPFGGLYISLVLFPKKRFTSIPLLASLAVIRTLEDFGFSHLSVLWPNDVLLNNKKVSGIICEQFKTAIICGVGLNVNIEKFASRLENVTSLKLESAKEFDVEDVLSVFIDKFNYLYRELQQEGLRIKEVLSYIYGIGESIEIATNEGEVKGTVYDIDDDWALLLRDHAGIIRKFHYGDVRRLVW